MTEKTPFLLPVRAWLPALLVAIAGMDAAMAATDTAAVVELNNRLTFAPAEITVKVGDTVEWRNIESYPHTVTADPGLASRATNIELPEGVQPFDSGRISAGGTFRYTFTRPGVYRYICLPHEGAGMLGTVIVQ